MYLDAEVPRDGESEFDVAGPEFKDAMEQSAQSSGDGWSASLGDAEEIAAFFGPMLPDADALRSFAAKLAANRQPIETFRQAVRIRNPASDTVPRTFVRCPLAGEAWASIFDPIMERLRDDPRWHILELSSSHLAPLRDPELVVDTLLDISRRTSA